MREYPDHPSAALLYVFGRDWLTTSSRRRRSIAQQHGHLARRRLPRMDHQIVANSKKQEEPSRVETRGLWLLFPFFSFPDGLLYMHGRQDLLSRPPGFLLLAFSFFFFAGCVFPVVIQPLCRTRIQKKRRNPPERPLRVLRKTRRSLLHHHPPRTPPPPAQKAPIALHRCFTPFTAFCNRSPAMGA
jgi:hypothetical protein